MDALAKPFCLRHRLVRLLVHKMVCEVAHGHHCVPKNGRGYARLHILEALSLFGFHFIEPL